ncbi:MAG TPA: hypothetical protein EYQ86_02550, partial [Bacteroidetes bacterium]|nr:hypothetical protein [Bacteroidota bacterium]
MEHQRRRGDSGRRTWATTGGTDETESPNKMQKENWSTLWEAPDVDMCMVPGSDGSVIDVDT